MKNPVLLRNFFIFTLILAVCVAGLGYHIIHYSENLKVSDEQVLHSQRVIQEAQGMIGSIMGMLSQQHKLMGASEANQEPYDAAKGAMSTRVGQVKELVKDNPVQMSRMTEIEHLSLRFKDELDNILTEARRNAIGLPTLAAYETVMRVRDDMLRLTNDILNEEYALLAKREQTVRISLQNYQASLFIGGVVACLIILIFNWYLLKAQAKASRAEESLRESEERLRLAIRGSNDGIFDWNFKTHEIYWSNQYKQMLGYEDGELHGDEKTFRTLLHPDDADIFWNGFNDYTKGKLPEFSCVFRMVHKSGRDVWIHGRGKALFDENGIAQRFIGAHTDITYLKEHERQLQEERDRAEAASEAKGEFLAHMSHEIRTPLTAVSGIAEIFSQSPDTMSDTHKRLVKTLRTSTETLKELITDILDFSKIESGEIDLHIQKFPLGELFEQVVSIMSVRANEKLLEFTVDCEDVKTTVFSGDKQRLRQVLINLVGNAIKFTEKGSVKVEASIEPIDDAHILRIDISDTGIGITEKAMPLVFEKFRQADSSVSRRYGGTGLGLPISRSLAELMGGTIKVESEAGKGAKFSVILPFTNTISEADVDMNEVVKIQKLNDRLRAVIGEKKKILLVEDYEGNIVVLSYILSELDCAFDVARTGLEGVQLWKDNHYDLILMDIQMPEMDGLTATRTIRKMENEQLLDRTPIVGLTAHALVADKQKCIDAGMDAYLSKPIVEADLKSVILRLLENEGGAASSKHAAGGK
ncbi:MAG: ATP-binding protein [Micavibrio sp.]